MGYRVLVLDSETYDPLLKRYGAGWCFKYHYPEVDFEVVMFGAIDFRGCEHIIDPRTPQGFNALFKLINEHDALVFHNALYDMGALRYLYRDKIDFKKFFIYDTMLLAKLHDQSKRSYSLDSITKDYNLVRKQADILQDYAWFSGIYQQWVGDSAVERTGKWRNCNTRPSAAILGAFCMSDVRRFPWEVLGDYCMFDVRATKSLCDYLLPKLEYLDLEPYSDILKVCLDAKTLGMRIDLNAVDKLSAKWKQMVVDLECEIREQLGNPEDFNLNSGAQLGLVLSDHGYDIPITDKGNYSITSDWLEDRPEPLIKNISRYRKALKAEKDYVQKFKLYQVAIPDKYKEPGIGWLYPTMKPLGATATGRFSSGGGTGSLELNVLAISVRNEEFGAPIREVFLPHKGEKLICRDFSNQEPRLQVHYAHLLKCGGVAGIVKDWNDNPSMKYHQKVADLTGLPYAMAKTVTLGLAYDMHAFGLSRQLMITYEEAQQLMKQYHNLLPFMQQLQMITSRNLLKLGYIRTIGGRKLYIDQPYWHEGKLRTQERKAMSKLVQGSAADQTIRSMIMAWEMGLKVLLAVHDEILITSGQPEKDYETLGLCMENSCKLVVPVVSEGGIGDNWGEAK